MCDDGLSPVLDAIRSADGLIIGSPDYPGEMTASFRALCYRLIFQNLTCNAQTSCCNQNVFPALLIMICNAPDDYYQALLKNYRQTLRRFAGPTEFFVSGDNLRLRDYSRLDWEWSLFEPEAKRGVTRLYFRRSVARPWKWERRWRGKLCEQILYGDCSSLIC